MRRPEAPVLAVLGVAPEVACDIFSFLSGRQRKKGQTITTSSSVVQAGFSHNNNNNNSSNNNRKKEKKTNDAEKDSRLWSRGRRSGWRRRRT
mmetsp:Transcript_3411/g.11201  ORF Transcript_3411/g.11201 Transcript_3411/m.11201 type:complete len:92 (-) Transcript_3411:26-301(-)